MSACRAYTCTNELLQYTLYWAALKNTWKLQLVQNLVAQAVMDLLQYIHLLLLLCHELHYYLLDSRCNSRQWLSSIKSSKVYVWLLEKLSPIIFSPAGKIMWFGFIWVKQFYLSMMRKSIFPVLVIILWNRIHLPPVDL